jgi:hypothetical protein
MANRLQANGPGTSLDSSPPSSAVAANWIATFLVHHHLLPSSHRHVLASVSAIDCPYRVSATASGMENALGICQ